MLLKTLKFSLISILAFLILTSCNTKKNETSEIIDNTKNESLFIETMQKHLDAVTNKDLVTLKSTLSPKGNMQLILPQTKITNTVEEFMKYHETWFAMDNSWSFETKILNTEIGQDYGIAITEIVYREPERDGKPYFNRMYVSYALQKIDHSWYIIKDHASSIEKSTDE
ncbi:YybH family protein [Lacinutrix iliipiscaria]|uniref:YybH family protein n=1 Tax=Lacinutrix iliipiscaria TaxID=1230532 RepID=A0ABW5WPK6_9FLAO